MVQTTAQASARSRRIMAGAWSVVLFVLGGLNAVLSVASVPALYTDGAWATFAGLYWLAALALWATVFFRRRHPVAPIVAGTVLAACGSEYLLLLIGLHHLMLRSSRRRAMQLAAVATGAVVLFVVRAGLTSWGDGLDELMSAPNEWIVPLVFGTGSLGALLALTALVRSNRTGDEQRRLAEAARGQADQLGDELVRRSERERIARDIHDTLAHRLSLLSLQGGALEVAVGSGDQRAVEIARTMRGESHRALDDLRALLGEIRAAPGHRAEAAQSSMRAIGELVHGARAAGATVDAMIMVEGVDQAATVLDHTVYRVVQEALTNAVKHAQGAPISIHAEASPVGGVRVRVSNPVSSASGISDRGAGEGISGIRERASLLGGEAWIGEHDGAFIVDVSFAWISVGAVDESGREVAPDHEGAY